VLVTVRKRVGREIALRWRARGECGGTLQLSAAEARKTVTAIKALAWMRSR